MTASISVTGAGQFAQGLRDEGKGPLGLSDPPTKPGSEVRSLQSGSADWVEASGQLKVQKKKRAVGVNG